MTKNSIQSYATPETILGVALLILVSLHHGLDYNLFQWQSATVLSLLLTFFLVSNNFGYLPGAAFTYFLGHIIMTSSFAFVLPIFLAVLILGFSCGPYLSKGIAIFTVLNALYVIAGYLGGFGKFSMGTGYSGFLDNSSMNGCLIACGVAFLRIEEMVFIETLLSFAICLTAIILSRSSIPFGVLAVVMGSYGLKKINCKGMALGTIPLLLGFSFEKSNFLESSGRFEMYRVFMDFWFQLKHWVFGTGAMTFEQHSRLAQKLYHFEPKAFGGITVFPWMHSDWLQVLFEYGTVGLLLLLAVFVHALYLLNKKNETEHFSLLCGVGSMAIFNYPLRYFVTALLGAVALRKAYSCRQ